MAAPTSGPYGTTATIYDPTGADTNPIADGWTVNFTGTGHSNWKRLSNKLAPSNEGSAAQAYRAGATYGLESEYWCELSAKGTTNGHYLDLTAMIADPNGAGRDFYYIEISIAAGADVWDIGGQKNATGTGVLATGTQEVSNGDYIALTIRDNGSTQPVIKGWYWALAGSSWSEIVTYTDTSSPITADGYFGLEATLASAFRIGTIYGGDIPVASSAKNLALLGVGS